MEADIFREYASIEDTHWWFRGRRAIFAALLARIADRSGLRILDIGFGTGAMLTFLSRYGSVIGLDSSAEAVRFARSRCAQPMVLGDVLRVPLRPASVDLVTAFDLLEHVDDDRAALAELARVCRPGGHALLTVPAFRFLWGNQDVISHHRRRYTLRELGARVAAAGFQIRTLSYFNALLFPAIAAVRVGRRLRQTHPAPNPEARADLAGIKSDFSMTKPGLVNDILTRILAAEGTLVTRWQLPVGVSVVCLAERTGS
jgi:ubiquinone/menaquinone biosynthesis C-methylase UbiE